MFYDLVLRKYNLLGLSVLFIFFVFCLGRVTWVNFCCVCAASLSELLSINSKFSDQLYRSRLSLSIRFGQV